MSDKWFNEEHYRSQKILQMNTTNYTGKTTMPTGGWDDASYQAELAAWGVTALQNFDACNAMDYSNAPASLTLASLNVSPNQYFSVPEYCQSVANYNIANPAAWSGSVPAEGWNAATILDTMWSQYKVTAWEHYNANWATQLTNPSSLFDTSAYLDWRAQKMGELDHNTYTQADAIKAIQDLGINPVQDFFDFGQDNGLTTPPALDTPIQVVAPAGWTPWGTPVVDETDPYAQDTTTVAMAWDTTEYTSPDGQNTIFSAEYPASGNGATLNPDDVITGGNAYNTLAVNMGANWGGFSQQVDADGNPVDSVTGVGRLQLNHASPFETPISFSARGIAGTTTAGKGLERVDINNVGNIGNGTISVSDLADSVDEIRLAGELSQGKVNLGWQAGSNAGSEDVLTFVLDNAGTSKSAVEVVTGPNDGYETVQIKGAAGTSNYIDLSALNDFQNLIVKGAGNVSVMGAPSNSIDVYDASEATGRVTISAGALENATVVKGGTGFDTLTINGDTVLSKPAWTGVEALAVGGSVTAMDINAANIVGLQQLDIYNGSGTDSLSHVNAVDFNVNSNVNTAAEVSVTGELSNLVYNTARVASGTVYTDAARDITVNVTNDGAHNSGFTGMFTAEKAAGNVQVNVAKATNDEFSSDLGGTINAQAAKTFAASVKGTLDNNVAFNVVQAEAGQDATIGRTFSLTANETSVKTVASADVYATGASGALTTVEANGVWDASFDIKGSLILNGDLSGARNVNMTLANAKDFTTASGRSRLDATHMDRFTNLTNLDVDAGGEQVFFADLGAARGRSGNLAVNISDVNSVEQVTGAADAGTGIASAAVILGSVSTSQGGTIDINLENVRGNVLLGAINAATNEQGQTEGDVNLTVQGQGNVGAVSLTVADGSEVTAATAAAAVSGDSLNLDFSGLRFSNGAGGVVWAGGATLSAESDITYNGSNGADGASGASAIKVSAMGGNGVFNMNAGDDALTFDSGLALGKGQSLAVNMGAGDDTVTFASGSINGAANIEVSLGAAGASGDTLTVQASAIAAGKGLVTLDVNCGTGQDTIDIEADAVGSGTNLLVQLGNFTSGEDVVSGMVASVWSTAVPAVTTVLKDFGLQYRGDEVTLVSAGDVASGGLVFNGNVYALDSTTGALFCFEGTTDDVTITAGE